MQRFFAVFSLISRTVINAYSAIPYAVFGLLSGFRYSVEFVPMKNHLALAASVAAFLCFLLFLTVSGLRFAPAGVSVHVDRTVEAEDARLNINTASATELEALPGIGPALSAAIIQQREAVGRFTEAEELLDVPGIGEKKLEAIRELLRFD